jgi:putative ABC transport system ATP-binding protein
VTPILEWKNVQAGFGDVTILSGFSLRAEAGERVLLYGPSGIGKSSVLKTVLGFVPIQAGEICCRGVPLEKKSIWEIRKKIAYVPQNPDIGEGPVTSIIDTIFSYKCNGSPPSDERVRELFDTFHLPLEYLEKEFLQLSGGEQQRVAVLIALLLGRNIFFLDEITASLDGDMKKTMIQYFTGLAGTTQVIVSHDPEWTKVKGIRIVELEKQL